MGGESGGVEESSSCCSSPKNKVKFLCSHGGKVLPRPSDGTLKYVGGETRVISVPRDITFSDLMKKLSEMVEGDMILKYQLMPEDLDALVSVRTDEDLKHMIEENGRHENEGAPLLRAFLFPSKPVLIENHAATAALASSSSSSEPYVLEQRYIDAINGIIRTSPKMKLTPIRASSTCSACSSPKSSSPDGNTADLIHESTFHPPARLAMHKVRSSPSIASLSNLHSSPSIQHDHSHYQNQNQSHHLVGYPSSSRTATAQDAQAGFGMARPPPIMSLPLGMGGKIDMNRGTGSGNSNGNGYSYYYSSSRPHKVFAYYDDTAAAYAPHPTVERVNVPRSPRKSIWE
ncbi:putative PB1 domain-containing protein [Lupinus albus]|uniref:Putative PB1 domain-containing protein n=1 Tax=Lupinus albus TaxID=3870 RepID=A0A6A4NM95_LUPAL|nr:putative PB1 domain-containing protein [Lupinus albus]